MKVWMTIEPSWEEIDKVLFPREGEDVSKTPLKIAIDHAFIMMIQKHEVSLKVTTMKRSYPE